MAQTVAQSTDRTCSVIQAGIISYQVAWDWQRHLATERSAGRRGDTLLLLQHPPTITLGRAADRQNILVHPDELGCRGVAVVETNRGGDVTYHTPGQLVGYPILKLSQYGGGLLRYLRNLEETLISVLATYGIQSGRVAGLTGVWVNSRQVPGDSTRCDTAPDDALLDAKVAAIGVHLSASGVTSHGFAFNVTPDLRGFEQIIPCGIHNRGVTSLERLLGYAPPLEEVTERVIACFAEIFQIVPMVEER